MTYGFLEIDFIFFFYICFENMHNHLATLDRMLHLVDSNNDNNNINIY